MLKDELSLVLDVLLLRKLEIDVRNVQSNPYEFSLVNNETCRQSNALDNSTNKAARFTPLSRFPLHFSNNKIHE